MLALAGALLAAGCGGRDVVVRDDGGRVLVEGGAARVRAVRARVPPLLLPRPGARAVRGRRRRLPHGRGRVAQRGGARLLRARGRQDARALDGARARAPAPLRPPAADRDPTGRRTLEVGGERYPLYAKAPRHLTIEVEDEMAVATTDVDKLAEEYEAEKPGRRLDPIHEKIVLVACAGLSCYAIYWVLNPVPAQRYRTSFLLVALALTFLVYRGWGARDEKAKPRARASPTGCCARLGGRARLHARHVRRVRAPRRAAQRPRHRSSASPRSCWCSRRRAARSAGSCPRW